MSLTDTAIKNAKPKEKPYKLADSGGLHVAVSPNGSRLWRLKYRFGGKEKLLSFGAYPLITLAMARGLRDAAKASLAKGIDPSVTAKIEKAQRLAGGNSFKEIAEEFLAKQKAEGRAKATLSKKQWLLDFVIADFGARPIAEITPAEILVSLRKVEKRGKLESARRLRGTAGEVFRYAIATARCDNDPTIALRGALTTPKVKHRAAITDSKDFGALLRAIDAYDIGNPETRIALQLMSLLYPRPGELRQAEWGEFDLDAAVWTIPKERAKMRREQKKPLPLQAVALLKDLQGVTGGGRFAFPSVRTVKRPMSEGTMNAALNYMGYDKNAHTPHGFRTTASTILNQSGKFNADAIEAELAHIDPNPVRAAYQRGTYWDERVRMAAWWADECDRMRNGAKIVQLKRT